MKSRSIQAAQFAVFLCMSTIGFSQIAKADRCENLKSVGASRMISGQLNSYLSKVSYERAFPNGERAHLATEHAVLRLFCSEADGGCGILFDWLDRFYDRSSRQTERRQTVITDESDGFQSFVDKKTFASMPTTLVNQELCHLSDWAGIPGNVLLQKIEKGTYTLYDGPNNQPGTTVNAILLSGQYSTDQGSFEFGYVLSNEVPGTAQILQLFLNGGVSAYQVLSFEGSSTRNSRNRPVSGGFRRP